MNAIPLLFPDAPLAWGVLAAVVAYGVAMSLTPGPITQRMLPPGTHAGVFLTGLQLLGTLWGLYLMICLAGVVLGALFIAAPGAQTSLRVVAGLCLLWLASLRWHTDPAQAIAAPRPRRFGEAVLQQLGNPTGWLAAAGVVIGFVPAGAHYPERLLTTAFVFCLAILPGIVLRITGGDTSATMRSLPRPQLDRGMALLTLATAALFWV